LNDAIEPEVFATGFLSPEGPAFDRYGNLYIVDWDAGMVYRITADPQIGPSDRATAFVNTGGMPTGSKFHRNGHLYVCDSGRGEVLDISPQGNIRVAAADWEGQPLRGPNDLIFAPNGDLYFTDPKGSSRENPTGSVYLLRADGTLERFATGFAFPNGIALSDDGRTLYLAETLHNRIHRFELDVQGHAVKRTIFAQLEGGVGPDGMAFDVEGNLYVAHFGKGVIAVLNPDGQLMAELPAGGARPTNVAFWETTLYVTEVEYGQVVRLEVGIPGQVLFGLR